MLSGQLLDVLACPKCKQHVDYDKRKNVLLCGRCRLKYKILKGDIPDMLVDHVEKF